MNRRKFLSMAALSSLGLLFAGCGEEKGAKAEVKKENKPASEEKSQVSESAKSKKILIAFYSRVGDNYEVGVIEKGNTHILADMIAEELGGAPTFEIKTVKEYAKDYRECTEEAKKEKEENARPALSTKIDNFADYDTIFLGYPIWWSDLPMPVYTFLESYDWNGKTVIPFCTSASDTLTGLEERVIPAHAKGSKVKMPGLGLSGKRVQKETESIRPDVKAWLKEHGYIK